MNDVTYKRVSQVESHDGLLIDLKHLIIIVNLGKLPRRTVRQNYFKNGVGLFALGMLVQLVSHTLILFIHLSLTRSDIHTLTNNK